MNDYLLSYACVICIGNPSQTELGVKSIRVDIEKRLGLQK
jgi:hypothetical protein